MLTGTATTARPRPTDGNVPRFAPRDIFATNPDIARRTQLDSKARLTELGLIAAVGQYYGDFASGQSLDTHLKAAKKSRLDVVVEQGVQTFTVPSTAKGDKAVAIAVDFSRLESKDKPVVIYLNEATTAPFDAKGKPQGSFATFLSEKALPNVSAVAIRTPGQGEGLAGAKDAASMERTKVQTAVTATFIDDVIKALRRDGYENIVIAGYSLGGTYANYYRAWFDGADGYIPIASPVHTGFLYDQQSWWRGLLTADALANASKIVEQLSVSSSALAASNAKTLAIVARNDEVAQRVEDGYPSDRVRFVAGGHISGITDDAKGGTLSHTAAAFRGALQELLGDVFVAGPQLRSIPRSLPNLRTRAAKGVVDISDRFPELAGGVVVETWNRKPGKLPSAANVAVVFEDNAGKAVTAAGATLPSCIVRVTPPMRGENIVLEAEAETAPLVTLTPQRLADAMAYAADKYLVSQFGEKRAPSFSDRTKPALALYASDDSAAPALALAAYGNVAQVKLVDPSVPSNPLALTGLPAAQSFRRQATDFWLSAFGWSAPARAAAFAAIDAGSRSFAEGVEAATRTMSPMFATAAGAFVPQGNRLGRTVAALDAQRNEAPEWVRDAGPSLVDRYHKGRASWVLGADGVSLDRLKAAVPKSVRIA